MYADAKMEAEADRVANEAMAEANTPSFLSLDSKKHNASKHHHHRAGPSYLYWVWVGGSKLAFSSKPKADHFCRRLGERIAEDLGDSEWDPEPDPVEVEEPFEEPEMDISLAAFATKVRRKAPGPDEWTVGTKRLLVVVMDWKLGDQSLPPHSEQRTSPDHYKEKIFPKVAETFDRMSFGNFKLDVTVFQR